MSLKEIEMANRNRDADKDQYWRLVMEEFRGSGLGVREFCRREGLRESSFYAWRRELGNRDAQRLARPKVSRPNRNGKQAQKSATSALVEVVTRPTARSQAIEIETPAGYTIRLGQEADRELVASVLASVIPRC
jgi:hypothetical protein